MNERFKKPTDEQLIDIAIIVNQGELDKEKLADMLAYCNIVVDRLYDNGDVMIPSKEEIEYQNK